MVHRPRDEAEKLTGRQTEVLDLLAAGRSTLEVAERLHLSPATVRNHVQQTMERLGAHNRLEAVALNRRFRDNPAARLLRWCEREGIALLPWQKDVIRAAFDVRPEPPVIPTQQRGPPFTMTTAREQWGQARRL